MRDNLLFARCSCLLTIAPLVAGAVPLEEAESEDAVVQSILKEARERVKELKEDVAEYYCTVDDEDESQQQVASASTQSKTQVETKSDEKAADSKSASASSAAPTIVCRLWHVNAFLGARETALGNPGEKCKNMYFDAKTGKFLRVAAM